MTAAIDTTAALIFLNSLLQRIEDPVPYFDYVGVREVQRIRERIMHTKVDPEGKAWIPWAPFTGEKRDFLGNFAQGIMWDTGKLLDSIDFQVDGAFGVDIGSDVWYAAAHQDGGPRLPQREIFGWDDSVLPQLAATFVAFLERGTI